ncbi:unnamed protein product [Rotaria socialis]|uniref:F-box domain-containing protein n=1 Tax=Rotaria socialis TaxID=392032 RepID=A0A820LMW4_9BILA|nr:unnamed protein product [Rotaria socialis]CAF4360047.1 unnamed protein product [Rotaria socialis]
MSDEIISSLLELPVELIYRILAHLDDFTLFCSAYNVSYNIYQYVCFGAHYQFERTLGLIDWRGNGIVMVMITFAVNVVLIAHHLITRHRMRNAITVARRTEWRRSLKLSLQLLVIALPYLIAWVPYSTVALTQIFSNTDKLTIFNLTVLRQNRAEAIEYQRNTITMRHAFTNTH